MGYGQYLDERHSDVERRTVDQALPRQRDGVDEPDLLEGIGWAGIREQQDRAVDLDKGLEQGIAAVEPVLGSGADEPAAGVAVERTAGHSLVLLRVERNHLPISFDASPCCKAYTAGAWVEELYASPRTASSPC